MSFKGIVAELPIGQDGMTGSKNQARIRPGHLLEADNVSFFGDALSKEGGAAKYNATVLSGAPAVRSGHDWWPTPTVQRQIIVCSDGKILKDSGGGTFPDTLKSGLTINLNDIPYFVEGGKEAAANNRKLFIFTPSNQIQVLSGDGAATANIATPAADWAAAFPTFGNLHEFRLWAGGNSNDPYRMYYTTLANNEDFTGAGSGSFAVYPGEGEYNVCSVSFKGLQIIFRYPIGIYMIDTRDPVLANWKVQRLSKTLGAAGTGAVCPIEDDILFMDPSGNVHLLSGITEFGNLGLRSVSDLSNFQTYIKENANIGNLKRARALLYPRKREVHIALPGIGSTVNNARMVVDLNSPETLRFRWSTRDVACESLWLKRDANGVYYPTMGDNAGFVWNMDQETKSKDNAGYPAIWQSSHDDLSWLDPSFARMRKTGKFLELVVAPLGNWSLDVQVYWDGRLSQSVSFNMGVTGAALGSFVLGTDILGNSPVKNRKRRITGSGRRISLRGNNSGAGQDYSILRFLLHFKQSSERLERE